ncbi:hypothetical protein KY338_05015, partial [Candidatus Woesearchaeota archaeon]|nr:hypothetical protein [Candidatus Woesearchaeota archaeon]MBW3006475.1 hypothetical protein [Candidatus Woesearchaeota archaeon]
PISGALQLIANNAKHIRTDINANFLTLITFFCFTKKDQPRLCFGAAFFCFFNYRLDYLTIFTLLEEIRLNSI